MTDIIPKAASGRYMGLSNVVTASSTTIAVAIGGVTIDLAQPVARRRRRQPRSSSLFGMVYFLLGALALRPVVEPDRRRFAARRGRDYTWSPRNSLTRRSTARGDRNDSSCHDDGRSQRNGSGWR